MGGDPEIRRMIREGEAKPDYKASMGASIWADPLNYISIGAGYKALRGGANTAFNGAESNVERVTRGICISKHNSKK